MSEFWHDFKPAENPVQLETLRHLANILVTNESTVTRQVVGYHGMSVEGIQQLLLTGKLPGTTALTQWGTGSVYPGDIFFYPVRQKFKKLNLDDPLEGGPLEAAKRYAHEVGAAHLLEVLLGLDRTIYKERMLCRVLIQGTRAECGTVELSDFADHYLRVNRGMLRFNKGDILEAIKQCLERKGVLVGFRRTIKTKEIWSGKDGDDLRIKNPKGGLGFRHLAFVQPQGSFESNFFEELRLGLVDLW